MLTRGKALLLALLVSAAPCLAQDAYEHGKGSTVERIVDIRVDDAPNPFTELRRLLNITLAAARR